MTRLPHNSGFIRSTASIDLPVQELRMKDLLFIFPVFTILSIALLYPGLDSPATYDSLTHVGHNRHLFESGEFLKVLQICPGRQVFLSMLYGVSSAFGFDARYFRLLNIVGLAASATMLVAVVSFILRHFRTDWECKPLVSTFAGVCGLIYLCHPLQTYTTLYYWQGATTFACLFYYSGIAAYLHARETRTWYNYLFVSLLFALGMLCKEIVVTLPAVLSVIEITSRNNSITKRLRYSLLSFLLCLPGLVLYVAAIKWFHTTNSVIRLGIGERFYEYFRSGDIGMTTLLLTQIRMLFDYAFMSLAPALTGVDLVRAAQYSMDTSKTVWDLFAVLSLLLLIVLILLLRRNLAGVAVGLSFFLLALLPESLFMPKYAFVGYRAILPGAGLLVALSSLFAGLSDRTRHDRLLRYSFLGVALTMALSNGALTYFEASKWNPRDLWTRAFDGLPPLRGDIDLNSYTDVLVNATFSLNESGYFDRARIILEDFFHQLTLYEQGGSSISSDSNAERVRAILKNRRLLRALSNNYARAALGSGFSDKASREYRRIAHDYPDWALGRNNYGSILEEQGDFEGALKEYEKAFQLNPEQPSFSLNLGKLYIRMGSPEKALDPISRSVRLERSREALMVYGFILMKLERPGEAAKVLTEAVRKSPSDLKLLNMYGVALAQSSKFTEALMVFKTILKLDPRNKAAQNNLDQINQELDKKDTSP
jgi:protein O-mannosyl-transferase